MITVYEVLQEMLEEEKAAFIRRPPDYKKHYHRMNSLAEAIKYLPIEAAEKKV